MTAERDRANSILLLAGPDVTGHYTGILQRLGYPVVIAEEGRIETEVSPGIGLALVDMEPGRQGYDGISLASRICALRDIPIVFLTGRTGLGLFETLEGVPCYGVVVKGSGDAAVAAVLETAFRLFRENRSLRESESRYRTLFRNAGDAIFLMKGEKIVDCNDKALEVFGTVRGRLIGSTPYDFSPLRQPDGRTSRDASAEKIARARAGSSYTFSWIHSKEDGTEFPAEITLNPIDLESGPHIQAIIRDKTEAERAEEEIRIREERLRMITENIREVFWATDVSGKEEILYVSPSIEEIWGYAPREFYNNPRLWHEAVHEEDRERVAGLFEDFIRGRGPFDVSFRIRRKDGAVRWIHDQGSRITDNRGNVSRIVGVARDVTDRHEAERKLQRALVEKDMLMKEINHRVKNNLSLIQSLINLKNAETGGSEDLSDLGAQIAAIGLIHDKLFRTESVAEIRLREYITELLDSVFESFYDEPVEAVVEIEDISLPTKTAVSFGLMVNELAVNAVKHGFAPGKAAVFSISVRVATSPGEIVTTVGNNGVPFPVSVDLDNPPSLGMRLVTSLTGQLGGSLTLEREPSPRFTIRFPISGPSDSAGPG